MTSTSVAIWQHLRTSRVKEDEEMREALQAAQIEKRGLEREEPLKIHDKIPEIEAQWTISLRLVLAGIRARENAEVKRTPDRY